MLNLVNEEEEDDNEYRFLKRFLFQKPTSTSTQRVPSVIDNLILHLSTKRRI